MQIKINSKSKHQLPAYHASGSAGMDLRANIDAPVRLLPLGRSLIPTGMYIELPEGFEAQVRPRSGLAIKKGLTVLNSPGTIDSDYRGEIGVMLVNLSQEEVVVEDGERIAQLVISKHEKAEWITVDTLNITARGDGGYGSTGSG